MTNIKTQFVFNPASDESVDSEHILLANTNITVQVCAYGGRTEYAVNEHGYDDPINEEGFWMRDHGSFRSLEKAQAKAVEVAKSIKGKSAK